MLGNKGIKRLFTQIIWQIVDSITKVKREDKGRLVFSFDLQTSGKEKEDMHKTVLGNLNEPTNLNTHNIRVLYISKKSKMSFH